MIFPFTYIFFIQTITDAAQLVLSLWHVDAIRRVCTGGNTTSLQRTRGLFEPSIGLVKAGGIGQESDRMETSTTLQK